jgi:hypothetical protein
MLPHHKTTSTCLLALAFLVGCGESDTSTKTVADPVQAFRQTWNVSVPRSGRYLGLDPVGMRFSWVESDSAIPPSPSAAGAARIFWRGSLSAATPTDSSRRFVGTVDVANSFDGFTADAGGYTITRILRVEVVDSASQPIRAHVYAELAYDWKGNGGASISEPTLKRAAD